MSTPVNLLRDHPFISFAFDAGRLPPQTWFALGEAMSKCQHLSGIPLKPETALQLASVYLARGVQATTAIEGNTLSTVEVQKIVDQGHADVSSSRSYLELEVQNVLAAVREIDEAVQAHTPIPITVERLKYLNERVLRGIPDKPEVVPGEFRQHNVGAGTYRAVDWSEVAMLTARLVEWLDELKESVNDDSTVEDRFVNAFLRAILAHLYIAWVHPFGNGNGRVARLIEVQILSESGIVPIVATNLLSDHYNKTRNNYYLALDAAQQTPANFIKYAVEGLVDELREQIELVREESRKIHWESYVYEKFRSLPKTDARDRQREVALALPDSTWLTPEQVVVLTPEIALRYGRAGDRMPARDLNDLNKIGLVYKLDRRYRARRELITAFIPPVA